MSLVSHIPSHSWGYRHTHLLRGDLTKLWDRYCLYWKPGKWEGVGFVLKNEGLSINLSFHHSIPWSRGVRRAQFALFIHPPIHSFSKHFPKASYILDIV